MRQQKGNVIFIIFMAVMLFAALSYAVSQSMRGGVNITQERADVAAAELIQEAGRISTGLKRFLMTHDYTIETIDMYDDDKGRNGNNSNCTTDACNLFHPDGGNVTAPLLPIDAADDYSSCPLFNGRVQYYIMIASVKGVGTSLPEVLLHFCGVSPVVCEAINVKQGLQVPGDPPIVNNCGVLNSADCEDFDGDMDPIPVTTADRLGSLDSRITGETTFCSQGEEPTWGNFFYHVLVAR